MGQTYGHMTILYTNGQTFRSKAAAYRVEINYFVEGRSQRQLIQPYYTRIGSGSCRSGSDSRSKTTS